MTRHIATFKYRLLVDRSASHKWIHFIIISLRWLSGKQLKLINKKASNQAHLVAKLAALIHLLIENNK
jgi:hypothetical protein